MVPIHELLSRIRWDPEFGRGSFALGYYDRLAHETIVVPFDQVRFDPADHYFFQLLDAEGEVHTVPYHRVREVYRDGKLIWRREG